MSVHSVTLAVLKVGGALRPDWRARSLSRRARNPLPGRPPRRPVDFGSRFFLYISAGLLLLAITAPAEVTLASLFQDHAVLQRGQPVAVWGMAAPGEPVRLRYRDWTADTTA